MKRLLCVFDAARTISGLIFIALHFIPFLHIAVETLLFGIASAKQEHGGNKCKRCVRQCASHIESFVSKNDKPNLPHAANRRKKFASVQAVVASSIEGRFWVV